MYVSPVLVTVFTTILKLILSKAYESCSDPEEIFV